jgi:hypothetical protein
VFDGVLANDKSNVVGNKFAVAHHGSTIEILNMLTKQTMNTSQKFGISNLCNYRKVLNIKLDSYDTAQLTQNAKALKLV